MTDTNCYLLASTFFESSKPFLIWFYFKDSSYHKSHIISDALRNLVLFAQFKKREKHRRRSVFPWRVFSTFFNLYK